MNLSPSGCMNSKGVSIHQARSIVQRIGYLEVFAMI
jgi:hypothetical protein